MEKSIFFFAYFLYNRINLKKQEEKVGRKFMMNTANKLTIFRMILIPVILLIPFLGFSNSIIGIPMTWIIIDLIFILACLTDKLDGYIARSRNQITTFGKFLDPIADKILVLTAMLLLVEDARLPAWIPVLVLFREFLVSGYRLIAVEKQGDIIAASIWGKVKTVSQMIALILALIEPNGFAACLTGTLSGFAFWYNVMVTLFMLISVIATVLSGFDYLKKGKDLFREEKTKEKK